MKAPRRPPWSPRQLARVDAVADEHSRVVHAEQQRARVHNAPREEQKPTSLPPKVDIHVDECNHGDATQRTKGHYAELHSKDGVTKSDEKLTMEEKLRRWKLTRQNRPKKPPTNVSKATARISRGNVLSPSLKKSRLSQNSPVSPPPPKVPGFSFKSTTVTTPASKSDPGVHALEHRSAQSSILNPALGKEHQIELPGQNLTALTSLDILEQAPVPSPLPRHTSTSCNSVTTVQQPEILAKNLIRLGIKFEKRYRIVTAFSIFKRAYHVLPTKSARLVERLLLQEREYPEVIDQVPSQDMSTAVYMVKVLERDLMDVLNHGTEKDLTELHAIGGKRARLLIDIRPFRQVEELQKVPGISANTVTNLYQHHTNWENHL